MMHWQGELTAAQPATSAMLITNSYAAEIEATDALAKADLTLFSSATFPEIAAAAEGVSKTDVIIAEIVEADANVLAVLDMIEAATTLASCTAVVSFPRDCLDFVAARLSSPYVTMLCDPSFVERVSAFGLAAAVQRVRVGEKTTERDQERLLKLADEVARIAAALAGLAGEPLEAGGDAFSDGMIGFRAEPAETGTAAPAAVSVAEVRTMIRARRLRDRFFPADLFADPAWDMLLDLLAARIERTRVAVSSLCIAASVPPTTALRTIQMMTDRGFFVRAHDPSDKRRVFITLSEGAAGAMLDYMVAARAIA